MKILLFRVPAVCLLCLIAECTLIDLPLADSSSTRRYLNTGDGAIYPSQSKRGIMVGERNNVDKALAKVLQPIARSHEKMREYYYNPPPAANAGFSRTNMFDLPPVMESARKAVKRRLKRKLLGRRSYKRRKLRLLKLIKTLKPKNIELRAFHKFNSERIGNAIVGYKRNTEDFFKIVENKKNTIPKYAAENHKINIS